MFYSHLYTVTLLLIVGARIMQSSSHGSILTIKPEHLFKLKLWKIRSIYRGLKEKSSLRFAQINATVRALF